MQQPDLFAVEGEFVRRVREFKQTIDVGGEIDCPCCGRYSKVYKRQIHKTLVAILIRMTVAPRDSQNYVDMPGLLKSFRAGRDFCILKYWGLIEEKPNTNSKVRNSGYWRVSPFGIDFINGTGAVAKYAHVFDDKVVKFSGDHLRAADILGNNFDYNKLMEA